MAKNWLDAQKNEKAFWESIFIKEENDIVYEKTDDIGWENFTKHLLFRFNVDISNFKNKTILDLGSGPAGVIRGFEILNKKENLSLKKLIAIDPLMDFYSNEIKILQQNELVQTYNAKGEKLPLQNNSVDYLFCINSLDHCENPNLTASEIMRVLKPGGELYLSLHLLYNFWSPIKKFIKYFDKNHLFHITYSDLIKIFSKDFININLQKKVKIITDQSKFTFKNIFKNKNIFRGFKRYISNYILYTAYLKIKLTKK